MEAYTQRISQRISQVDSRLCLGLDPRADLIDGSIADFLKHVIDATADKVAAYKPNMAYFEALGSAGIRLLEDVLEWIPDEVPVVLDAKRSDIGETQSYYAKACFEHWKVDAVTLNPWLGFDTVEPFLDYPGKAVYLLCVTSNPGARTFALRKTDDRYLFEDIQDMAATAAGRPTEIGLVAGLTNLEPDVWTRIADLPLLVPGLGAQGGDAALLRSDPPRQAPLLVNVSRGILFREPEKTIADKTEAFRTLINKELAG